MDLKGIFKYQRVLFPCGSIYHHVLILNLLRYQHLTSTKRDIWQEKWATPFTTIETYLDWKSFQDGHNYFNEKGDSLL